VQLSIHPNTSIRIALLYILLILPYTLFFGIQVHRIVRKVQGRICNKDDEQRHLLGSSPSQQTNRESIPSLVQACSDDDDNGSEWLREGLFDSQSYLEVPSEAKGRKSTQGDIPLVSSVTVDTMPVQSKRLRTSGRITCEPYNY